MALKLLQGTGIDLHVDPKGIEYKSRGDVSDTYFDKKFLEFKRFVYFLLGFSATIVFCIAGIFISSIFVLPLFLLVPFTFHRHWRYLQAWSNWNKFARKTVAVIEGGIKQYPIYNNMLMPWINLKAHMDPSSRYLKHSAVQHKAVAKTVESHIRRNPQSIIKPQIQKQAIQAKLVQAKQQFLKNTGIVLNGQRVSEANVLTAINPKWSSGLVVGGQ